MRIPPRDIIATVCVAIGLLVYGAWIIGAGIPGFVEVGAVALAVLVLGIVASISAVVPGFAELLRGSRMYLAATSILGVVAFVAAVWAFIYSDAAALGLLVLATVVLWAASTARHVGLLGLEHGLDRS